MDTHLKLYDGQTIVLGGLRYTADREIGNESGFAKYLKAKDESNVADKELFVFVTVTIVDPLGKRVHSDDEMSFAQNSFPPQMSQ